MKLSAKGRNLKEWKSQARKLKEKIAALEKQLKLQLKKESKTK